MKHNHTVESLDAMDDDDFTEAVTEDLSWTGSIRSPFQDPALIRRTLATLEQRAHFVEENLRKKAEDPNVSADNFARTASFRRHLLVVIETVERQLRWQEAKPAREISGWKALLNEVLDEIEGTELDDVLDEINAPYADGISLRTWIERRRAKDPSRIPEWLREAEKEKELLAA